MALQSPVYGFSLGAGGLGCQSLGIPQPGITYLFKDLYKETIIRNLFRVKVGFRASLGIRLEGLDLRGPGLHRHCAIVWAFK